MSRNEVELASAPLLDHLDELRQRLIWSLVAVAVGMAVAFWQHKALFALLIAPLAASDAVLISTSLTGQFVAVLNLSFWSGLALALPMILGQIWGFIAPGLYPDERRWAGPFVLGAGVAFGLGAAFAYVFVLPAMVRFFLDFLAGQVQAMPDVSAYIGMVVTFLVSFGLSFELPIVALILTRMGIVNHEMLRKGWRFAVVICLALAALITPTPDPGTMLMVALPLYLLYELSIVLARVFALKPLPDDEDDDE